MYAYVFRCFQSEIHLKRNKRHASRCFSPYTSSVKQLANIFTLKINFLWTLEINIKLTFSLQTLMLYTLSVEEKKLWKMRHLVGRQSRKIHTKCVIPWNTFWKKAFLENSHVKISSNFIHYTRPCKREKKKRKIRQTHMCQPMKFRSYCKCMQRDTKSKPAREWASNCRPPCRANWTPIYRARWLD